MLYRLDDVVSDGEHEVVASSCVEISRLCVRGKSPPFGGGGTRKVVVEADVGTFSEDEDERSREKVRRSVADSSLFILR